MRCKQYTDVCEDYGCFLHEAPENPHDIFHDYDGPDNPNAIPIDADGNYIEPNALLLMNK